MADLKVVDAEQLDADLTIVADAIRSKGGTTEPLEFPQGMKQAVEAIQSGGGGLDISEYITGNNAQVKLFSNTDFGSTSELTLNLQRMGLNATNETAVYINWFSSSKGLKKLKIIYPKRDNVYVYVNSMFGWNTDIEVVDFTEMDNIIGGSMGSFAETASKLTSILGEMDVSKVTTFQNAFDRCPSLKDVSFKKESIFYSIKFNSTTGLTDESVQSIIDGLADLTGATAQTFTLNVNLKNKLTETQLATITGKNWTLA